MPYKEEFHTTLIAGFGRETQRQSMRGKMNPIIPATLILLSSCSSPTPDSQKPFYDGSTLSTLASLGLPIGTSDRMVQGRMFELLQPVTAKPTLGSTEGSECDGIAVRTYNEFNRQLSIGYPVHDGGGSHYYLAEDGRPSIGSGRYRYSKLSVPDVTYFIVFTAEGRCEDWFAIEGEYEQS